MYFIIQIGKNHFSNEFFHTYVHIKIIASIKYQRYICDNARFFSITLGSPE